MSEPVVVVDVGTVNTTAAVLAGGAAELLPEPGGGPAWPTAAYRDDTGRALAGAAAVARRRARPDAFTTWGAPPERNGALLVLMLTHVRRPDGCGPGARWTGWS